MIGIAALILNDSDERARMTCLVLVLILISTLSHYFHPIIKSLKDAYLFWELFGVTVNFFKLSAIYIVSSLFKDVVPRFAIHISSILIIGIVFRVIFYCSWVTWDSDALEVTYQILIPSLNTSILILKLANRIRTRLESRANFKEGNGY